MRPAGAALPDAPRPRVLPVTVHEFTHIGRRAENQDGMATFRSPGDDRFLLVVADGLGGHSGGALAARTVIETAGECWNEFDPDQDAESFLTSLVEKCHAAVNQARDESGQDPRSTIAALLGHANELVSIHAGDSRVIQFSRNEMVRRTVDHSVAELNVMMGNISEAEQSSHPSQAQLFAHVGGEASPDTDIQHWDPERGNRFVVCSDGFWEIFPPGEMLEIFDSADPSAELASRFESKFSELENQDNTTAILAELAATPKGGLRKAFRAVLSRMRLISSAALLWFALASAGFADTAADSEGPWLLAQETESRESERRPGNGDSRRSEEAPREEGGDTQPEPNVPSDTGSQGKSDTPLPIEHVQVEVDREIAPGEAVSEAVSDELRKTDRIDPDSEMVSTDQERVLADTKIVRLRQTHNGVPVYGAEVTVMTEDGRIVRILGHPASEIDIESTTPAQDYPRTVAAASKLIDHDIETMDEGTLVIFPVQGGYRLAWEGLVRIDQGDERVVFDAETAEILLRQPLVIGR